MAALNVWLVLKLWMGEFEDAVQLRSNMTSVRVLYKSGLGNESQRYYLNGIAGVVAVLIFNGNFGLKLRLISKMW